MINKVNLMGFVGADPEIKHLGNENQVASFKLATSESYKNKQGERITQTEWHNIVVWNNLSKIVEKFIHKGSQIYIEGKIETKSYEKDGQTRYFTQINCKELKMIGRKDDNNQQNNHHNHTTPSNPSAESDVDMPQDDLPF